MAADAARALIFTRALARASTYDMAPHPKDTLRVLGEVVALLALVFVAERTSGWTSVGAVLFAFLLPTMLLNGEALTWLRGRLGANAPSHATLGVIGVALCYVANEVWEATTRPAPKRPPPPAAPSPTAPPTDPPPIVGGATIGPLEPA